MSDEPLFRSIRQDDPAFGGYTLRVTRSKLPENRRAEYDRYVELEFMSRITCSRRKNSAIVIYRRNEKNGRYGRPGIWRATKQFRSTIMFCGSILK